ncbi:retrovirus-related Pol polyprotein from transposon opus [Trichonephila clavipes]|nr:retrovirus-related Pol polyprotein from transposon opus [Trichonephila clavipes]
MGRGPTCQGNKRQDYVQCPSEDFHTNRASRKYGRRRKVEPHVEGPVKEIPPQYNRRVAISISIRTFAFGTNISSQRSVGRGKKHPNYCFPFSRKVSGKLNRKAHEIAAETAEATQNNYTSYYNLRSREKQFKVGDKVLVLHPSSTHKLMKTWIGPATIIEITRPYSAEIELDDGGISELHFNKLRPYIAKVGQVGLIFNQDSDFGDLHYAPTDTAVTSMVDVTDHISSDCQELEDVQRLELLNTLKKFSSLFSSLHGLAKVKGHNLKLKPDFTPKKIHPYRIPIAFAARSR